MKLLQSSLGNWRLLASPWVFGAPRVRSADLEVYQYCRIFCGTICWSSCGATWVRKLMLFVLGSLRGANVQRASKATVTHVKLEWGSGPKKKFAALESNWSCWCFSKLLFKSATGWSSCMNINGWEGMIFIGLNAAISVHVSNELGSGRPRATMYAVIVVVVQSVVIGLLSMAIILASREHFAVIFTSGKELQGAVAKIAYLLAVTMVLNSVQPVISGVAIGGGWQGLIAYINLGCYYIFGLLLWFILGYALHLGAQGIWAGLLCGTALQIAILLYIVWKTDWKAEAAQASERVRLWSGR